MLATQQRLQGALAGFNRLPPQVLAVEFEQIECAKDNISGVPLSADQIEHGKPLLVAGDGFAVDYAGARRQPRDRRSDQGKAIGKIVAVAAEQSNAGAVAPRHDAEAVMLDFVN